MANEIKAVTQLQLDNGNFKLPKIGSSNQNITQATPGGGGPGHVVATNAAAGIAVVPSGVTTLGWVYIKNAAPLVGGDNLEIGRTDAGTFRAVGKLKPGEECVFRLFPGIDLRVRSDGAATPADDVAAIVQVLND